MTKHFKDYRHWEYPKEDDLCVADYKSDAIKIFERFWKRKINPNEIREVFMREFIKIK